MFQQYFSFSNRFYRRLALGSITFIITVGIGLGNVQPSYAISWLELMIRGVQIVQISNISNAQEEEIGKGINQELISSGQVKLYRNSSINSYINEIGQQLAKTSQRPNIPYTFQVVDDNNINAFATMGGYVYVNKGLIATADNEAELASVIGHEIGHIAARHAIQKMRDRAISQGLLSAAGVDRNNAIQIGVELAVSRPNSRADELQADHLGLEDITKANYAPAGMLGFMQKLLSKGGSPPTFLSTHPATSDRLKILQQDINPQTANVGNGLDNQAYKNRIRSLYVN
ncbi:M48 family metallopeptidase [Pleurocapsa sp. FMAR1]|uniref:M48 family metallopeptidase n=1 Tax=Pleurocapsa sp. FMAR1 TaxID=3040204 RepID=UPI0029C8744B|nr:M48 family metallopeptidase [Pleurocapsa sp. FMAR1]